MIDIRNLLVNYNHTPDAICNCKVFKLKTFVLSRLAKTTHPDALNHRLTTFVKKRRRGFNSGGGDT